MKAIDIRSNSANFGPSRVEELFPGLEPGPHSNPLHIEAILIQTPVPFSYIGLILGEPRKHIFLASNPVLDSLIRFVRGEFRLEGLEVLPMLNGLTYSEIDRPLQRRLEVDLRGEVYISTDENSPIFEYIKKVFQNK